MPLYRAELQPKKIVQPSTLLHDVSQVLYLPFDYDDGSYARDRSGYNNHGTIYGATPGTGKIGMARSFDGVDDYVEVPDSASLREPASTQEITIEVWVYIRSLDPGGPWRGNGLVAKRYRATADCDYQLILINGGNPSPPHYLYFSFFDGVAWQTYRAGGSPTDLNTRLNEWLHLAATYNHDVIKFYINGVQDGDPVTITSNGLQAYTTSTLKLAYEAYSNSYLDAIYERVRVTCLERSLDEIQMSMYRRW